jgi:hypothetical protein
MSFINANKNYLTQCLVLRRCKIHFKAQDGNRYRYRRFRSLGYNAMSIGTQLPTF